MAHGVSSEVLGEGTSVKMVHQKQQQQQSVQQAATKKSVGVIGSRRIFAPAFKLKVLDSYRNDIDCRGNQRATARKYGIHRRQIQKWLQCEDNLRNSCAESGSVSTTTVTAVTAVTAVTSVTSVTTTKSDGAEATGPAVTPAAPALNLSLARLHGDELATQQGPPPLLPHGSPSSPQYVSQSAPVLPVRVGYQEFSQEQQRRLRREDDRYPEARADQEQASYYVPTSDGQRGGELENSYDRNEVKVYQTLSSYRSSREEGGGGRRCDETEIDRRGSPSNHRSRHSYGDVDSSVDGKSSSYGSLLAPSMIKSERASPDSAATPGPCESSVEPGAPRLPLSHQPTTSASASTSTSVHFDSPRSPCLLHVHVHAHAHAHARTPDSEKPRESSSGAKGAEDARAVVKEEIQLEEEEEDEGREAASSFADYQRPPAADSRAASPAQDREESYCQDREGYSLPSSPRGPGSSGRSSTSCSDSEMDPLDCSSAGQSSNDLTRRRSFSLRFKLDVLDAFHRDIGVAGNQRATARKFGINRRQVQKWLGQETELRGEIALRGNSRQRLGPVQEPASGDSPVDLRTSNHVIGLSQDRMEEYHRSPLYCYDVGSSQHVPYYQHHQAPLDPASESELAGSCNLSCCMGSHAVLPAVSCYQDVSIRGSCYSEQQNRLYCYSPREYSEIASLHEQSAEELSSPLKRQRCTLSCCYETLPSPKRLCLDADESRATSRRETPPQETPLCLVKPKRLVDVSPSRSEPVTSTVPTPPAPPPPLPPTPGPTSKKDAILFKPYLDNPVSKPAKENLVQRDLSPVSGQTIVVNNNNNNNNNNCQSICNLNEARGHDYALELSLRLPVSWRTHPSPYAEFPQVRSAFVRYPASPHYS